MNTIDVWSTCPVCGVEWNKKKFSNISLVHDLKNKEKFLKCPNCLKQWYVNEFPKTWK